ncbi:MAG: pyruvate kinase [Armatimonadota bacterium]|jgi:pyruvate kinase
MQRTKIVCTLGPASSDSATVRQLIAAGMDVARLNFSHGTHDTHRALLDTVRHCATELGQHVALLQDLQGPRIRVGALPAEPMVLVQGQSVAVGTGDGPGSARIPTTYEDLPGDVAPGDRILMDDGLIELRVSQTTATQAMCEVVVGGELYSHKGINLPGVNVTAPSFTDKDRADLEFGIAHDMDYVALSFVRSAADIETVKNFLDERGADTPVVAKLEKPEAIDCLDDIVAVTDATMVARGDLAVEASPEMVPIFQKRIINTCREARVPVITATQMLESMTESPRPTRAEASDVANAIFDGTDATMLSGETAVGKYPVDSVHMMRKIAQSAEDSALASAPVVRHAPGKLSVADATARAACEAALDLGAKAIIACTHSGFTAQLASKCRPAMPIIAATPFDRTARRVALYWGVMPLTVPPYASVEEMMQQLGPEIVTTGLVRPGDPVVVIAGTPIGRTGTTNMMRLWRVGH